MMEDKSNRKKRIEGIRESLGSELGKLPPQAVEFEEAILGAVMLENQSLITVSDILKPEMFYKEAHALIFEAATTLFQKGEPVDILTVTHTLRKMGKLETVGGPLYISGLTNRVASTANVETHARVVFQKYIGRELIRVSNKTIHEAYDETSDVFDIHANSINELLGCIKLNSTTITAKTLVKNVSDDLAERMTATVPTKCIPSSIVGIRNKIGGYYNSDLIIIAARPGMGKTALVLIEAFEAAKNGRAVAIFSLEMSPLQLMYRFIAFDTGIDLEQLTKGKLTEDEMREVQNSIGRVENLPLYISENPKLTTTDFRAQSMRLKQKYKIELIVVDYLQLMEGSKDYKGNKNAEVTEISRTLKLVARELDTPVIALSQLTRDVEKRTDKRPNIGDLRESGAIEQDADIVAFVYRDQYYNSSSDETEAEIIFGKNRSGKLGYCKSRWTPHIAKYSSYTEITENKDEPTSF